MVGESNFDRYQNPALGSLKLPDLQKSIKMKIFKKQCQRPNSEFSKFEEY